MTILRKTRCTPCEKQHDDSAGENLTKHSLDSTATVASVRLRQRLNVSGAVPRPFATAAIAFVSDEYEALRQQPDALRPELARVPRALRHGSIISHRVRGNAEQKSAHISTREYPYHW